MAEVFFLANLCFPVFIQQSFLLTHAELALASADGDEPAVSPGSERGHFPRHFGLAAHDGSFLAGEEALGEGVVDVDIDDCVSLFWVFLFLFGHDF